MRTGQSVERLAFAAAAWTRYLRGADEQGYRHPIHGPRAEPLHASWLARVSHWLEQITQRGILSALAQLNDAASPAVV